MKPYLFVYNLASAAGWAYVLFLAIVALIAGKAPFPFYETVKFPLQLVQTAALLELFHSLFGIVRSPFLPTFLQVGSRVGILWVFVNAFYSQLPHFSIYLIVISWALVEVPRYLFYAINIFVDKVPFPIFFLRYNLFLILYPTGITGEFLFLLQTLLFANRIHFVPLFYIALFSILLYPPFAPFMYFHMIKQRNRASASRRAAATPATAASGPKLLGIEFPKDKTGARSTTIVNRGAIEASTRVADAKAADAAKNERNWRFGYAKHFVKNVELSLASPQTCLKMCHAGLDYIHDEFRFIGDDGSETSFKEAMKHPRDDKLFHTGFIKGSKPIDKLELEVPYKDKILKNEELVAQLEKWTKYGTIEPEAQEGIMQVIKHQRQWLDLSSKYFVLLGASSAMGPLQVLLALGANVIAIDINIERVWENLIKAAENSSGTLTFPLRKNKDEIKVEDYKKYAGCNLFTDTPEIKEWLLRLYPDKDFVFGGYAYLDADRFVKLSVAMDAIISDAIQYRKRSNTSLAFLCSPTDCFVVPNDARDAMIRNLKTAPLWQTIISKLSFGKFLIPNARKQIDNYSVVDGFVVAQGPNYALAKRIQHWRCMVAREENECVVSTNIAPSTATRSVVHNAQFAAAYGGMHHFVPMEVMYQETSNAVMGALLIHDICNDKSVSNPKGRNLKNPQELFREGSFHGGIWRMGWKMNSIGEISAVCYYVKIYRTYLFLGLSAVAALIAALVVVGPPHVWF